MKDETTNSYELTLTPNYVSDWNFHDALRELIQNGTDQEVLDPDNEFQIDYSPKEKVLRLKNRKSVLKINTLLLGRSSKANNEDTVGQFGEGYKIAALVLNRLGKTFTIYNNEKNEVWDSRFKNSEKWLEKILCFYVSKRKTDDNGLCIEVGNVTQGEFNDLYKVCIRGKHPRAERRNRQSGPLTQRKSSHESKHRLSDNNSHKGGINQCLFGIQVN